MTDNRYYVKNANSADFVEINGLWEQEACSAHAGWSPTCLGTPTNPLRNIGETTPELQLMALLSTPLTSSLQ